jgi:hypothetical protein
MIMLKNDNNLELHNIHVLFYMTLNLKRKKIIVVCLQYIRQKFSKLPLKANSTLHRMSENIICLAEPVKQAVPNSNTTIR